MSDLIVKVLFIFAGIVGTLSIISAVLMQVNNGVSSIESSGQKMTSLSTQLDESDYTKYDGVIVLGSDVRNFIKSQMSQDSEICISVVTSKGTTNYIYTDGTLQTESTAKIASTTSKKSSAYINPTGSFLGAITRNETGAITLITFTQQ